MLNPATSASTRWAYWIAPPEPLGQPLGLRGAGDRGRDPIEVEALLALERADAPFDRFVLVAGQGNDAIRRIDGQPPARSATPGQSVSSGGTTRSTR